MICNKGQRFVLCRGNIQNLFIEPVNNNYLWAGENLNGYCVVEKQVLNVGI